MSWRAGGRKPPELPSGGLRPPARQDVPPRVYALRLARSNDSEMSIRFFIVNRAESGRPIGDCLCSRLSLSRPDARRLLRDQQVRVNGAPCVDPHRRLQRGQRVQVRLPKLPQKPAKSTPPRPMAAPLPQGPRAVIRHVDAHVVVVEKPIGLTTMRHAGDVAEFGQRAKRYLPPTLADLLPDLLARRHAKGDTTVRAVHRLDKDTSGLVVFARTVEAERHLGQQFRAHKIERHYLAVVRGQAKAGRIDSWLVRERGDGRRGSSAAPGEGQRAITNVRVVECSVRTRSSNAGWRRAHASGAHPSRRGRHTLVRRTHLRSTAQRQTAARWQRHRPRRSPCGAPGLRASRDRRTPALDFLAAEGYGRSRRTTAASDSRRFVNRLSTSHFRRSTRIDSEAASRSGPQRAGAETRIQIVALGAMRSCAR